PVVSALIEALGEPLLGSTLLLPGEELPLADPEDIRERLQHDLDLVIDGGHCGTQPTTVIDLSSGSPELVRAGAGDLARFGLE
ncbi:Sua5/YciO/YrdC/YwlC family protein, partial [Vibrio vulnificus]|uniref:Sua5/YciO/YrdC/YwlC family protein n=2 Tax=Pseudomonadota TaxID=1224 RepID=UPI0039B4BECA